jgi:hypothetical protein
MKDKKILFAGIMAATAVGVLILFLRTKKRRFIHHPKAYTRTQGVSEFEFTL